ncbi:50S ribosomal protein L4 [Candidatus Saganbacteria bacterium]|nr:50S ribosomal protein L4 [Candidatus Saganbacteria bacterium]
MVSLPLYNNNGQANGELSVAEKIFGIKLNEQVMQTALVWYQASRRRGTHSTKTRAEVSGGGKKPWKQKGTGRARAGSSRSPLWRHGGVIFGPKPRDYNYTLPRKVRKLALINGLANLAQGGKAKVVETLKIAEPKTKLAEKLLKNLGAEGKILIVLNEVDENFQKAGRNLAGVTIMNYKDLNIYDLLNADCLVLEKPVLTNLEEFLV